ncbi:hypothetical protein Syn8016DRAFT_0579 [Synechococcus sp. WH 8016]|nr:hypothetical protein Syn8016DRAFT_0579 [Synechococcus sp. WH 8016]
MDRGHEVGNKGLGRDVAVELESEWMVPLLDDLERVRPMAWSLGLCLYLDWRISRP